MKRLMTLIAFLGVATFAFSQSTITLTGKILEKDTKEPLMGASVVLKGTTKGAVTNLEGIFSLTINSKDSAGSLVVSFVGFESIELKIKEFKRSKTAKNVFSKDIFMEGAGALLESVVVVGYGEVKRKDATGAVHSIKSSDRASMPKTTSAKKVKAREPARPMAAPPAV